MSGNKGWMYKWLSNHMTGCAFAAKMTHTGVIDCVTLTQETAFDFQLIDMLMESAADASHMVVLSFEDFCRERDLRTWIEEAEKQARWKVICREHEGLLHVTLHWLTPQQLWSNVMGLGPLITMPPTRRSPYFGLALWPGKPANQTHTSIDFKDIPTPFPTNHKDKLRQTRREVRQLLAPHFESDAWRTLTFCLPILDVKLET